MTQTLMVSSTLSLALLLPAAGILAAASSGVSCDSAAGAARTEAIRSEAALAPGLASALGAVTVERIRADLEFIASPELAGRDTPSPGLRTAARFIRARLQTLGIAPGAPNGYLYEYPLLHTGIDPERSFLEIGEGAPLVLRMGSDYAVDTGADLTTEGPLVWCGEGDRNTFKEVDVEGCWALVLDTAPTARARRYAERAGAAGLVVIPDPDQEKETGRGRVEGVMRRQLKGRVIHPSEQKEKGSNSRRTMLPQVRLTEQAARTLRAHLKLDETLALGSRISGRVREERRVTGEVQVENVCGFLAGDDPVLGRETIIISAHYDHVGTRDGDIYFGADDNGSGTSGLLALAEALVERGPLARSVLLIWVSGEEKGLYGSKSWADNPWLPDDRHAVCNINIDMIGRNPSNEMGLTPSRSHDSKNALTDLVHRHAESEGFTDINSADAYYRRSDHAEFARLDIPVAFLFADVHEDYHRPTDTPDKIDYDKIRRTIRMILRVIEDLQEPDSLAQ